MTTDQIIERVKNSASNKVKVAVTDIDGVLRGKYIHKNILSQSTYYKNLIVKIQEISNII